MGDGNWFRRGRRRASPGKQRADGGKRRWRSGRITDPVLRFEELENRRMLATFTVINLDDTELDGDDRETIEGSLRWAVEEANDNDEDDLIVFIDGLAGTIGLNNGQIEITSGVRIRGPSPNLISVQADGGSRIFRIDAEQDEEDPGLVDVEVSGVSLVGGDVGGEDNRGGAILSLENLTMYEVIVSGNSATGGGGGIFHDVGELTIERALFQNNEGGGIGGGAILIGATPEEDAEDPPVPEASIRNSTITGNEASSDADGEGYGGGVLLFRGELAIEQCTFFANSTAEDDRGGGIAAFGDFPEPDNEEDPEPENPNVCTVLSSILWDNEGGDLQDVGMTTPEDEEEEPAPLEGIIESLGYNIIGESNVTLHATDIDEDPLFTEVQTGPNQTGPGLTDVGGVLPVLLPQPDSPAVDAGDPELGPPGPNSPGEFEQRGRHFARVYDYTDSGTPRVDIGATELQRGTFVVDLGADESDRQYSNVGTGGGDPYTTGNFSMREALLFSELNPEVDTIEFISGGTVQVTLGAFQVISTVFIEGPTTAILTINAFNSSRIFEIDNGAEGVLSDISIRNVTLQNARGSGFGGAIFNRENLILDALTIRNSTATLRGGAIYTELGELTITNSTINNNSVADDGGAIYINGAGSEPVVTIKQSTISGNRASDRGAGITNNGGHLTISYSTITLNNSSSTLASGIANFGAGAVTEVRSTIISGNTNNDLGAFFGATATSFVSLGYNLVGNGIGTTSFDETGDKKGILNPMLDPLAITGGRVQTHRPRAGSPVIDMGDPDAVADEGDVPEFDERGMGFSRVFDGDNDGVDRIDIGAYELQTNLLVVDNAGDVSNGNLNPGNVTLREAIEVANQNPGPDSITFDIDAIIMQVGVAPAIGVGSTLPILEGLKIIGPGSGALALNGLGGSIFLSDNALPALIDVEITGLELSNSSESAIVSRENLTLDDILFLDNISFIGGGALFHENGALKLSNSLISGNIAVGPNVDGGALYIRNASAEITGYTTIVGNYTYYSGGDGGALAIKNSTVIAKDLTIAGNFVSGANSRGGGVFLENSTFVLEGAVIAGNSTVGSNSRGGGIAGVNSHLTFEKSSLIANNSTVGSQTPGGGIYLNGGSLAVNNSQVVQNTTAGLLSSGGAIAIEGTSASIFGSTILENSVAGVNSHGGGISSVGGTLTIRDSTVAGNKALHAESLGGGVYSDTNLVLTQTTSIVNSTISGNSAGLRGGGVFNADGRMEIKYSTITNNSVPLFNSGSGVASRGTAATATFIQSSIIAGNQGVAGGTASDVDVIDAPFVNSFTSQGNNVIGTGNALGQFTTAGDKTGILDPKLGVLADNGGAVMTHELLSGSPAINNGSAAFNPNSFSPPMTTDQRGPGFARVRGGRVDAGAFESEFSGFSADFNSNGRVDGNDFLAWQRGVGITTGATKGQGDANLDGAVNGIDLAQWRGQFGAGSSEAAATAAAVSGGGGGESGFAAAIAAPMGDDTEAPAAVSAEPAGASLVFVEVASVAGAGVPGGSFNVLAALRPAAERRAARDVAYDAAHTRRGTIERWAVADRDDVSQRVRSVGTREASEICADLAGEDVLFALLGEGLL